MTRLVRALPPLKGGQEDQALSLARKQQALYQLFKEVELHCHAYFWTLISRKHKQVKLRGGTSSLDSVRSRLKVNEREFEARLAREFLRLQTLTLGAVEDCTASTYVRLRKECEHLHRTYDDSFDLSQESTPKKPVRSASSTPLKFSARLKTRVSVVL